MLDNTRIRQLAHQHLTGVGDHCIINFARALIEEAARSTIAAPAQDPVATVIVHNTAGECRIQSERLCPELPIGMHRLYAAPVSTAAPVVPEWQPIETAPLNKNVLLWWRPIDDNKYAECAVIGQISFYEQGQWWNGQTGTYQDIWHVTKWMPVPAAPKPDA